MQCTFVAGVLWLLIGCMLHAAWLAVRLMCCAVLCCAVLCCAVLCYACRHVMRLHVCLHSCLQPAAAAVLAANPGLPLVCLENAGGIRADLSAGNVTLGQVQTVLPFGNTCVSRGGDLGLHYTNRMMAVSQSSCISVAALLTGALAALAVCCLCGMVGCSVVLTRVSPAVLLSSLNNGLNGWTGDSTAAGRFPQVCALVWLAGWLAGCLAVWLAGWLALAFGSQPQLNCIGMCQVWCGHCFPCCCAHCCPSDWWHAPGLQPQGFRCLWPPG